MDPLEKKMSLYGKEFVYVYVGLSSMLHHLWPWEENVWDDISCHLLVPVKYSTIKAVVHLEHGMVCYWEGWI